MEFFQTLQLLTHILIKQFIILPYFKPYSFNSFHFCLFLNIKYQIKQQKGFFILLSLVISHILSFSLVFFILKPVIMHNLLQFTYEQFLYFFILHLVEQIITNFMIENYVNHIILMNFGTIDSMRIGYYLYQRVNNLFPKYLQPFIFHHHFQIILIYLQQSYLQQQIFVRVISTLTFKIHQILILKHLSLYLLKQSINGHNLQHF
ncbi:transmembrane protein, putative (macronuclear) [Tetrahymena thermophila SB210]|uniref:Transmembrane protein, putative n=1 Tax=Tetrahymena thermophila (strain SB210) TaxID=312017 RepID=W7X172_TETTS|nr:transmembrane protein, putative [Tetrahymena thermophila SB210]EWS72960.1 transmembrane protein, putative [Tetrahymena thermophila SB210]|eukprot:XP_012654493.1 transmembrane protein, putative [Tetrahymena thermophila SB210]